MATTSNAQSQPKFRLSDIGTAQHNIHGKGIELQFLYENFPEGAEKDPKIGFLLKELCRQFGPKVIPQVLSQTETNEPDYIGVRLFISGGVFKKFVFQAFEVKGNQCGEEL